MNVSRIVSFFCAFVAFFASRVYALTEYGCEETLSGGILSAAQAAPAATNKVLVVVCACSGGPATASVGQMVGQIFTNQISVDLTVRDSSFNKLGIAGSVVGVITNNALKPSNIANDAGKLALKDYCEPIVQSRFGVAFSDYQSVIFLTPETGSGPAGKEAKLYGESYASVFIDGLYWNANYVISHEYGHALGMDHSGVIYDNASQNLTNADPLYGDDGCMMGTVGPGNRQYNALHKYELGWIPSNNVAVVTSSGDYTVFCSEIGTNQTQLLRIGTDMYVSYRAPLAKTLDTNLMTNYRNATMVSHWDDIRWTRLNAALKNNMTFADKATTCTVTQVSCNGTTAVVRVTFYAGRTMPVANGQSLTTAEDAALFISLSGSTADGSVSAYLTTSTPAHGTLTQISGAQWSYKPSTNFNGQDSFGFQIKDSLGFLSTTTTVALTVTPLPDPPSAGDLSLTVEQDVPKTIQLAGGDPDGDPVSYTIVRAPVNGVITGIGPLVTYTPNTGYLGADSFTYQAVDNTGRTSNIATVTLTISGGLIVYLPFDSAVSTKAPDLSGNGFNGTFKNMAATNFVAGKVGNALTFDGQNDSVEIADKALLRLGNQHTLAAWIKPDNTNNFRQIMGKGVYSYNMAVRFGKIAYVLNDGATTTSWDSVSRISTGTWTHVACTYDGVYARIYLNGRLDKQAAYSQTPAQLTDSLQIGAGGGASYYFKGLMDDLRIYQRALSAEEVSFLAHAQTFSSWAQENASQLGGQTSAGDDPGGLGLENLSRYAFGGSPTNGPEVAQLDVLPAESDTLFRFGFNYNALACDLAYYVEVNTMLSNPATWSPILSNVRAAGWTGSASWSNAVTSNGFGRVEIAYPMAPLPAGFFRVRAVQP